MEVGSIYDKHLRIFIMTLQVRWIYEIQAIYYNDVTIFCRSWITSTTAWPRSYVINCRNCIRSWYVAKWSRKTGKTTTHTWNNNILIRLQTEHRRKIPTLSEAWGLVRFKSCFNLQLTLRSFKTVCLDTATYHTDFPFWLFFFLLLSTVYEFLINIELLTVF